MQNIALGYRLLPSCHLWSPKQHSSTFDSFIQPQSPLVHLFPFDLRNHNRSSVLKLCPKRRNHFVFQTHSPCSPISCRFLVSSASASLDSQFPPSSKGRSLFVLSMNETNCLRSHLPIDCINYCPCSSSIPPKVPPPILFFPPLFSPLACTRKRGPIKKLKHTKLWFTY